MSTRRATPAIARTDLPGGVRVVTEHVPDARSASIGVWVAAGSRDEPAERAGLSHFLEHLLFKGTETRSARSIAESVDAVGGELNAHTGKEYTAYYTRLPAEALGRGLELLGDVLTRPALRPADVEAERQVILEELLMDEDSPEDRAHTLVLEGLFPHHPLGRDPAGTHDTVSATSRDDIATFFAEHYRPPSLVLAAAGSVHHDRVVDAAAVFGAGDAAMRTPVREAPDGGVRPTHVLTRPTEQVHVALGFRALPRDDPDRFVLDVVNHVLGGGMSSRLFQEVRETRGLAYSVYSSVAAYTDAGALVVYAGTAPSRLAEVVDVVQTELEHLLRHGIGESELGVAVGFLRGSLLLGLEDTASRMARLATSLTTRGRVLTVDEQLAAYEAVTLDDVARVLDRVLGTEPCVAVVGPVDEETVRTVVG